MAGKITVTNHTLVKEVPKLAALVELATTCDGYISSAGISFAKSAAATPVYSIDIAAGFTAAGFDGNDLEMILVSSTSGLNDGLYTLVSDIDTKLIVTEAVATESAAAAGTVVIYGVGVYKITPTKPTRNLMIIYSEGIAAAGEAGMIPCVVNGSYWAAKNTVYTAFAATVGTAVTYYLFIETAPYLQADGTILVMLKPVATKSIYTDHRPQLGFIELP